MKTLLTVLALVALLTASVHLVHAQSGGGYDLSWNTIAGGGVTFATGGSYSLGGTIGQPDTGASSGGNYVLLSGFWGGGSSVEHRIYLPVVLR